MNRWHATSTPQHMLLGSAVCVLAEISFDRRDGQNKPGQRRRP